MKPIEIQRIDAEGLDKYHIQFLIRYLPATEKYESAVDFGCYKFAKNPNERDFYEPIKFRGDDKHYKLASCISAMIKTLVLLVGIDEARKILVEIVPFALEEGKKFGVDLLKSKKGLGAKEESIWKYLERYRIVKIEDKCASCGHSPLGNSEIIPIESPDVARKFVELIGYLAGQTINSEADFYKLRPRLVRKFERALKSGFYGRNFIHET